MSRSSSAGAAVPIPGLPASQLYLPMPFLDELEEAPEVSPVGVCKHSFNRVTKQEDGLPGASAQEEQALLWVRSRLRAAQGEHTEPDSPTSGKAKRRRLADDNDDVSSPDDSLSPLLAAPPGMHSDNGAAVALAAHRAGQQVQHAQQQQQQQQEEEEEPPAEPVDWATLASSLADRAELLAAADAEAMAAATAPAPVPLHALSGGLVGRKPRPGVAPGSVGSKETLEPSPSYKGVWRVVSGPRMGLFKAQISTPGRAGRPKRLDYFATDMEAAQCYDRAALEKFGVEGADINFPATSYGYPVPGKYGLLQPKTVSRRARCSTPPLATRQAAPEYLDEPLEPGSKSSFIGVRLAKNCRGWLAKIKHKGEKHLIGTYRTEEEAARAWDRTAIYLRGPNTQTNFPIAQYLDDEELAARCGVGVGAGKRPRGTTGGKGPSVQPTAVVPGMEGLAATGVEAQAWQEALANAALLGQHPDLFAAAAAHAAAAAAACGDASQGMGILQLAAQPMPGIAGAGLEGGSGGEETDENGAAAAAAANAAAAAAWQLGQGLIEGQLHQLEGVQHVLLAPSGGGLNNDLARLFAGAVGALAYMPPAAMADPTQAVAALEAAPANVEAAAAAAAGAMAVEVREEVKTEGEAGTGMEGGSGGEQVAGEQAAQPQGAQQEEQQQQQQGEAQPQL